MSRAKYSPALTAKLINRGPDAYIFNVNGDIAPDYDVNTPYDSLVHFGNYVSDGFDSYGYSAFSETGEFVGHGDGVDRNGYSESDYGQMTESDFYYLYG
jgi:hypothetical protein